MPLTVLSGNPTGTNEESQDSALKYGNPVIQNTPAPASLTGSASFALTAQQLLNGIITVQDGTTATTLTFPTAATIAALLRQFSSRGITIGDTFYVTIINGGTSTGITTLSLAGATGLSFDPGTSTTIPAQTERTLAVRFTLGTPGSETAVVF